MKSSQQDFTFINVTAGKQANTRIIKRHVSNLTNRRKRQEAVKQYQESLAQVTEQSSPVSESASSTGLGSDGQCSDSTRPSSTCSSRSCSLSHEPPDFQEPDDEYREFDFDRQQVRRLPILLKDYWPSYQRWAWRHLKEKPVPEQARSSSPTISTKSDSNTRSNKGWRISESSLESLVLLSVSDQRITVSIPRIDPPSDFRQIQWGLKTCQDFVRSSYDMVWNERYTNTGWWESTLLSLGIWRECFPLSVEFIQAGQMQEAFFILNAALSVTPAFFKSGNPGLLIALLGAMMYTCQIPDARLSNLIRSHVTQLSMVHLGVTHPISLLLREQLRASDATDGRTDLLSIAVIDTFEEVFGAAHFLPLSMRWGYVRRSIVRRDYSGAEASIDKIVKFWNAKSMPASPIPRIIAFERTKITTLRQNTSTTGADQTLTSQLESLDKIAETAMPIPVFIPGQGPALRSTESAILKKLGRHLLLGSHYALALYIYTHIPNVFLHIPEANPSPFLNEDPDKLALIVSRILVRYLKNELKSESTS